MSATAMQVLATPTMHAAQAKLVDDIKYHSEEVFRLKSLLNSRQPVSKLPPEILSNIFLQQAEIYQQETLLLWRVTRCDDENTPAHKAIYAWTSVALVCRRWREIALQCAQLWTCVVLDERVSPEHVYALLSRARGLPLTVVMHALAESHCAGCVPGGGSADNYHEAVELLDEVLPQTRKLALFVGAENHGHLFGALRHPAPLLEWLHVEGVGWYSASWTSDTRAVALPREVFSPGTPPLRYLSLSAIAFNWDFPLLLPTLRHLKVEHRKPATEGHVTLTLEGLLRVLRNAPLLETLDLDEHSTPTPAPDDQSTPVDLPHLRFLRLSLDNLEIFHLLSHLRFPHTTTLHLAREERYVDSDTPLGSVMVNALKGVVAAAFKDMAVSALATRCPSISIHKLDRPSTCRIWAEDMPSDGSPPALPDSWDDVEHRQPRLVLELRLTSPLMRPILDMLDLHHLRVLSIQDPVSSPPRWPDMLQRAENVAMVDVRGTIAFGLGAALVGWVRPPSMDTGAPLAFDGLPLRPDSWVGFAEVADDTLRFAGDEGQAGAAEETSVLSVRFPRLRVLRISKVDFPLSDAEKRTREKRWRYFGFPNEVFYGGRSTPYGLDVAGLARSLCLRADPAHGATRLERLEFVRCQCHERERLVPLLDAVSELWWDGRQLTGADLAASIRGPS